MNVLHITNWYPNQWNQRETLFIQEQFRASDDRVAQELWHVQVRNGEALFHLHQGKHSDSENYLIIETKISAWWLQELLTLSLLLLLRIKLLGRHWDGVNIHIAYPLLRFTRLVSFLFNRKLVITEHWSAYRRNFNLPDSSKGKRRIQNIFHHGIPVITVSKALRDDIVRFSQTDRFPQYIVPNVVDPKIFYPNIPIRVPASTTFLMVASWTPIKSPLLVMLAFAELVKEFPNASLRIVGYGAQWSDMQEFVAAHHLSDSIALLGAMPKSAIAEEMRLSQCFVHASKYETFSVVCAEALCCGLPVIASEVGGIPEFVNANNGILVDNTHAAWLGAMRAIANQERTYDPAVISLNAIGMFSPVVVGGMLAKAYYYSFST